MKRARKWLLLVGALIALCLIAYFALPFFVRPPIQVPRSASWIRCSEFGYWLAYDLQVKFSAPYEDSLKTAESILAKHRAEAKLHQPDYVRIEIKNGRYLTPSGEDVVSFEEHARGQGSKWWFRPDRVKNGIFIGERGSYVPQIWIDRDRNIFYYRETD